MLNTPLVPNNQDINKSLSLSYIEMAFTTIVLILGLQTLLTFVAQQWGISFKTYLLISPITLLIASLVTRRLYVIALYQNKVNDLHILGWLSIIGIVFAILTLITNHPTTDDYFYIPNAVYFIHHPDEPMDFNIHFFIWYRRSSHPFTQSSNFISI
jgi:hypothetical protein